MSDTQAVMRRLVRENRGRTVHAAWIKWASQQPDANPSWLVPWQDLDAGQREADMRIGDALTTEPLDLLASIAGLLDAAPSPPLPMVEADRGRILALAHVLAVISGSIKAVLEDGADMAAATTVIGQETAKLREDIADA